MVVRSTNRAATCRDVTAEEKAEMPPHMRRDRICDRICDRGRPPLRLLVPVDGETRIERTVGPFGLSSDGPSVAPRSCP